METCLQKSTKREQRLNDNNLKERCNSLLYKYFDATGFKYIEDNKAFILYRLDGATLQIHDVYSETGLSTVLRLREEIIATHKPIFLEGYVDKNYENKDRSMFLMEKDGFSINRETEDYIYYIKKVKYGKES